MGRRPFEFSSWAGVATVRSGPASQLFLKKRARAG